MIIIAKDAEKQFIQDIKHHQCGKVHTHCLHFQFCDLPMEAPRIFEYVITGLKQLPEVYAARIYLCHDGDVLILVQDFMIRRFTDMMETLCALLKIDGMHQVMEIYQLDSMTINSLEQSVAQKVVASSGQETPYKPSTHSPLVNHEGLSLAKLGRRERRRPVIQMIEDDQLTRTLAGTVLNQDNDIIYTKTGQEGLNTYFEKAPNLVFLDIGLPDMSGHDVLDIIYRNDPAVHVVMFSGRTDEANIVSAMQAGAKGFLPKPFTPQGLLTHVEGYKNDTYAIDI